MRVVFQIETFLIYCRQKPELEFNLKTHDSNSVWIQSRAMLTYDQDIFTVFRIH